MKILIIAGHGEGDPGAVGNGYKEADLTRELAGLINQRLGKYCACDIADMSKDWFNYTRLHGFPFAGYDYMLEIHFNSGGGTGVEIFTITSRAPAEVEKNIVSGISSVTGYKNRGTKQTNYTVISAAERKGIKAALLEVCFIDSAADVNTYQAKKTDIADAVTAAITQAYGLKTIETEELTMTQYEELKNEITALKTESERKNTVISAVGEDLQKIFAALSDITGENYRQNDIINMVGADIAELKNAVKKE